MNGRRDGFTLLEILVAVVIVGIMSAFAMPRLKNGMDGEKVRNARRAVVSQLSQARGAAVSRGCRSVFHIVAGTDPRAWVTTCQTTGTGVDTVGSVTLLGAQYGVTLSLAGDSLTFAANGVGMGTSWMGVKIGKGSKTDTLAISPLGQARW